MEELEAIALEICSKVFEISGSTKMTMTNGCNGSSHVAEETPLRSAKNRLIDLGQSLIRLAAGPTDYLLHMAFSTADPANLGAIVRFNIAQAIPLGKSVTATDLAQAVGLSTDVLTRIVRFGIGNGIFTETKLGHFGHSALSELLATSEHVRNIVLFATHELSWGLSRIPDALALQKESSPASKPLAAFNLVAPQYPDLFDFFQKNAESNERYHLYLKGRINTPRWAVEHLISSWPWNSIGSGTIVDCGGSIGHTCVALAPICPAATFIVQDMSTEAMQLGSQWIAAEHHELSSRISFDEHDFFKPQTVVADAYVFRHIFHDWSDQDCLKILRALTPSMKPGAKVLVSEGIVPDEPARPASSLDQKQIRIEDAIMLAMHNARERSVSEFVDLFTQASPCFKFRGKTGGLNGAFQSILEFEFHPPGED